VCYVSLKGIFKCNSELLSTFDKTLLCEIKNVKNIISCMNFVYLSFYTDYRLVAPPHSSVLYSTISFQFQKCKFCTTLLLWLEESLVRLAF